jgi:hypothetical protein
MDSTSALSYEWPRLATDGAITQPIGVAHRQVLRDTIAVMDQTRQRTPPPL